jgi:zinc transporter
LDFSTAQPIGGCDIYVLSILTAVLLPMILLAGVFGRNVAGLPGIHDLAAFAW